MGFDKDFENDLEILSTHSRFAFSYGRTPVERELNCSLGEHLYSKPDEILSIFDWDNLGAIPDDVFHPFDSGCIKLNDNYLFGIRCDHLIWIDYDDYAANKRKTLLIGNHKGATHFRVITYNEPVFE